MLVKSNDAVTLYLPSGLAYKLNADQHVGVRVGAQYGTVSAGAIAAAADTPEEVRKERIRNALAASIAIPDDWNLVADILKERT